MGEIIQIQVHWPLPCSIIDENFGLIVCFQEDEGEPELFMTKVSSRFINSFPSRFTGKDTQQMTLHECGSFTDTLDQVVVVHLCH